MNPVIKLLGDRLAARSILPDALPEEIVTDLIEAARLTPSCRNFQPWRWVFFVTKEGLKTGRELLAAGNRTWATRAPLLILGHTRPDDDCVIGDGRAYHQFDLGMATMNIMLAATHHGLTARPMAGFDPEIARLRLQLQDDQQPLIMLAVGKPGTDEDHLPDHFKGIGGKPRERKEPSEIITTL